MHNNAQQCTTMHNNAQQCTTMHNNAQQCTTMHNNGTTIHNNSQQQQQQQQQFTTTTTTRRGPAIGPHTGRRCWPLLAGVWRAIAFLIEAWCGEGEVPTAANLNLYRGWKSCVGWHCDDEPLFGKCGDAKLIVSVSFGSSALFRWRRQSCSDGEGHLCWLGHGDILVMDGQCQDEFLHRMDPGRGSGSDLHYRSVGSNSMLPPVLCLGRVACCLPTCAQGSSGTVVGMFLLVFFGFLGFFLVSCAYGESWLCWPPFVHRTWVTQVCLLLTRLFGWRSGGALPLELPVGILKNP